jgi:hypothetical protein
MGKRNSHSALPEDLYFRAKQIDRQRRATAEAEAKLRAKNEAKTSKEQAEEVLVALKKKWEENLFDEDEWSNINDKLV